MKCNLQKEKKVWIDKKGGKTRDASWCSFFDVECTKDCIFIQQLTELKAISKKMDLYINRPTILTFNEDILKGMKEE
ncbi:TPA_asm: hypothetical protein vir520_00050 [Caudoviricetes sp. vir520]|nr:TPA_asm: hypothetical protein vir520_00050 [Caudoviricetes sp. vir520]